MDSKDKKKLETRVANAAAAELDALGYVSAIDMMRGLGWLSPRDVDMWRTRRHPTLEHGIQTNPKRIAEALRAFAAWAKAAGLEPTPADYVARTAARERLQFSKSGDPADEAAWCIHWVSPKLSAAKRARLEAKANKPPEPVAVEARHPDWQCHRCGGTDLYIVMEPEGTTCLACAGLGHLEMLPSGDALLTRRARAASKLTAVVVRWSKTRKRNERIGCLVEPEALASARARIQRESGG